MAYQGLTVPLLCQFQTLTLTLIVTVIILLLIIIIILQLIIILLLTILVILAIVIIVTTTVTQTQQIAQLTLTHQPIHSVFLMSPTLYSTIPIVFQALLHSILCSLFFFSFLSSSKSGSNYLNVKSIFISYSLSLIPFLKLFLSFCSPHSDPMCKAVTKGLPSCLKPL